MIQRLSVFAAALLLVVACGKQESTEAPGEAALPTAPPGVTSGIEKSNFDTAVRPQDDLYQAVNGVWLKNNPVPSDRSNYGAFTVLADQAELQIRSIVEALATQADKSAGSDEQRIGDYYATYMDEKLADELGIKPLSEPFAEIDALTSIDQVPVLIARLQKRGVVGPLAAYVHQDAKDPTKYAGDLYQAGLSLPDRDYYLSDEDTFAAYRKDLQAHVARMFELAALPDPAASAGQVLSLETQLAQVQWDRVANRDPVKTYNPYSKESIQSVSDAIDWPAYLEAAGYGSLDQVLISQPSFVTGFGELLKSVPLAEWKTYLRWHVLTTYAPLLSKPLADEDFAFFGKRLNGQQEQKPRWKRGVDAVQHAMGEAVGKRYVEAHFPAESKARIEGLVDNLLTAYGHSIDALSWMSEATKSEAKRKLSKFSYKIGYPDKWRDYAKLEVVAGDSVGNAMRAASFDYQYDIAKLGSPVDRDEWHMTPQTVNAYYNPEMNEIVFPAAILQPPFFDPSAEDAANYGGIGAVIGHEISHGFDDQGSQYDGDGVLKMWWTDEDRARFTALADQLAAQYDAYEPIPGQHVDGHFTLGENIADLGGLTIAHDAYLVSLDDKSAPVIDELTGDQRFYMAWAQVWRRNYTEENLLSRLKSDPHAPSEYRCNGIVSNLQTYYSAFDVGEADRMYLPSEARIKIW